MTVISAETKFLRIILKDFPPSINKLYISLPHRGKGMSSEGRNFQRNTMYQIQQQHGPAIMGLNPNKPYEIEVVVYFPLIYNKGWPDNAQQRFKKRDADNLLKLLLDTLAKVTGVDDANYLKISVEKRQDPENQRIEITMKEMPDGGEKEEQ